MPTKSSSFQTMNRRKFLTLSGLGLTNLLAACGGVSVPTVNPTPTAHKPGPTALPTRQVAPSEADWLAFASSLHGTLIRPDNSHYATARQLFSTRFDTILPAGLAY